MPRCFPPANDKYVFDGHANSQAPHPLHAPASTTGRIDESKEMAP